VAQLSTLGIIKRAMRFIFVFIALSLSLSACSRHKATTQEKLTGTWVHDWDGDVRSTNVIAADGSYQCQIVGFTNGSIVRFEGTLIATNGVLIDTVTADSQTNAQVPRSMEWHSFRFSSSGSELFLIGNNGATQATLRKVER
jgi:hypothetical protein